MGHRVTEGYDAKPGNDLSFPRSGNPGFGPGVERRAVFGRIVQACLTFLGWSW